LAQRTGTPLRSPSSARRKTLLKWNRAPLYPALHRLEDRELVCSEWGVSDNNRKAKFYRLTAEGRKELRAATSRWWRMTRAIGLILGESNG
jgi:PadR family transcriptional regulator, regulatory protein PadR